jgi:hypothetical protein
MSHVPLDWVVKDRVVWVVGPAVVKHSLEGKFGP